MRPAARAPRVAVVGAGVGGLASAIRLAAAGAQVTVFERGEAPGGKLRRLAVDGAEVAAGPTVLTLPHVFAELFAVAGRRLDEALPLDPLEPACRHFFADGARLDLHNDPERSRAAIRDFAGEAGARGFDRLRAHAARIWGIVREPFLESPVPSLADMLKPSRLKYLPQFLQLDSGRSLWDALGTMFADPRLRMLYARYATYGGSSPLACPATLTVIIHVEQQFGVHAVRGGIARLADALADAARGLGVTIHCGAAVERIRVAGGRVRGVVVAGAPHDFDLVVANCDAADLHGRLLDGEPAAARAAAKLATLAPSLSAFLWLARADAGGFPLAHHNVFFPRDSTREFADLFDRRRPPSEPTVYLCVEDRAPGAPAPAGGERMMMLTNAPAVDGIIDWKEEAPRCKDRLLETLSRAKLALAPTAERTVTPADFAARFPSSRGAIYGAASHSRMAAFERPPNRVAGFRGLYLVGGSAHPGAGLPMVALSAKIAAAQAASELGLPPAATRGATSTR